MTSLLLIRHATNDYIETQRIAGWLPGVHLNEHGRAQAQALVARLEGVPIAAIYSSPLERAVQTAEPLAQARGLEIRARDGLGETHTGDWDGLPLKELAQTKTWQMFQVCPSLTRLPNGETGLEMQTRALAELDVICAAHPQDTVAIFTHADIIKAVLAFYLGAHLDHFQRIVISPASISVVSIDKGNPHILRVNDTGRMDDIQWKVESGK